MSGAVEVLQQLHALLQQNNLPITTDNLNRAALAVARGVNTLDAEAPRTVQTRARRSAATPRPASNADAEAPALNAEASALDAAVNAQMAVPQAIIISEDANARVGAANAPTNARVEVVNAPATQRVGAMPTGPVPEEPAITAPNIFAPQARPHPNARMPVVRPLTRIPDESGGLGYDPRTEELDAYGRPQMRMPRAESTNNPLSPAFLGIPAAMLFAPPAVRALAGALRITPKVVPALRSVPLRGQPTPPPAPPQRLPWTTPRVYNQSTGNLAEDVATMLDDAARVGNQRGQEVLLGTLRGPQAIARRARRTRNK